MSRITDVVQLALRERRGVFIPLMIWALVTLVCTVAGPFGTLDALGVLGRFGYWSVVVGLSVLGSTLLSNMKNRPRWIEVMLWAGFVLLLSLLIWGLNATMFDAWMSVSQFIYLIAIVGVVVLAVHGVFWLIDFARPTTPAGAAQGIDPQARFLRRLPLAARAPLVRIEAQDHYLNVVTTKGSALILMRLGEAVEELSGTRGLLVHRSHWVALNAVTSHRRDKGRDVLVLSDGAEIPVSRSNRAAAQAAGLF